MSTPRAGPPAAYMLNVCADCSGDLLESERLSAHRCVQCQCQMHADCGMRDPRENVVCENCFMRVPGPLKLEESTAVEDVITELDSVRKELAKALLKGASREEIHAVGKRIEAAAKLINDASRLEPRVDVENPEGFDPNWWITENVSAS